MPRVILAGEKVARDTQGYKQSRQACTQMALEPEWTPDGNWVTCELPQSAKIQALGKVSKTDNRDIQTKTEGFKGEPTSLLHYKIREEQPEVFKQATFIYPVTL